MMNGKELYQIYAPSDAKWTNWVRPVPFVAIDQYHRENAIGWTDRKVFFCNTYQKDTAILIDLPGQESIELGISLARLGYRPIPLFNGTDVSNGARGTTDTYLVESALMSGGEKLKAIPLAQDANPVFLLDSTRTNRFRDNEAIFDNSWDLYGQDLPSYQFFKQNGIDKMIIVGDKVQPDIKKVFLKFQMAGISFYLTDGYTPPHKIILKKTIKERLEKEEL